VRVEELAPGVWRWTALHPEWMPGTPDQCVGSYLLERPDALVLIDPLAPPAGSPAAERFWAHLDRDVERHGKPVVAIVLKPAHVRSTQAVVDRYPGARAYGLPRTADALRPGTPLEPILSVPLPAGLETRAVMGEDPEVALHVPDLAAVIVADLLMEREGALHVWQWYDTPEGEERYRVEHLPAVSDALAGPLERVLVTHGEPVMSGGRQAIDDALARPPRSMRYGAVKLVNA
jgi:hypothetical protein